jgi:hypothetical protein
MPYRQKSRNKTMNKQLKTAGITLASLLLVAVYAGEAAAHCRDNQSLGTSRGAVDTYRILCSTGDGSDEAPSLLPTSKLFVRVDNQQATVAGRSVSAQIGRDGAAPNASVLVTDASGVVGSTTGPNPSCPATNASGQTALIRGNGQYDIVISKTGTAAMNYGMVWHCQDVNGLETLTTEIVPGAGATELAGNATVPFTPDLDFIINR